MTDDDYNKGSGYDPAAPFSPVYWVDTNDVSELMLENTETMAKYEATPQTYAKKKTDDWVRITTPNLRSEHVHFHNPTKTTPLVSIPMLGCTIPLLISFDQHSETLELVTTRGG